MIDMRYKPYFLPQVHAPEEYVLDKLKDEGIKFELVDIDPNELNPMQGIVFSSEVNDFDVENMPRIWVSRDNDVADGHHRMLKGIMSKKPVGCIKLTELNGKDSARVLNKIQDIYEYEQQLELEEVEVQDAINGENDMNGGISTNELLATLESSEMPKGNECKVIVYRQKPISENSTIGNFFLLTPNKSYNKYEVEFENLLDTNNIGLNFQNNEHPVDSLAKIWFPNADFDNLSKPFNIDPLTLKNKAISERAKKLGYDGIKYGDLMVQGLK